ncbi:hypothetical protein M8C21_001174 [Ambrosia artemisiifolia]|uniref:WAT1-related protein n=1 Tax=Ambrosia artemisiifolia TaxID=4212 RepID=A0AAD5D5L3_AMBAR|nr:hypothetical protein M8C21_001174 [Ambrosia artemisiifolia]
MKEYGGMVATQVAQVLLMIVSKSAIADGMSSYSFIFYSNAIASIILLPFSNVFKRSSNCPPFSFNIVAGFLIVGLLGFFAQMCGYTGVSYSSATLGTTLLNLIPGFTFILAALFRMEVFDVKRLTTQAKFIGTVVSIAGAIIMTLYQGPPIISSVLKSKISLHLLGPSSNWVLGGILLIIDAIFASMYIIAQGIFGYAFLVTVQSWCVRRRGPLFVAMFHPVGIVIANLIGVIFLGDGFYLGSLLGSIIVVVGFYTVMWGKAQEQKIADSSVSSKLDNETAPLLQDVEEQNTSPTP